MSSPLVDPSQYVVRRGNDEYGPFNEEILRDALQSGNLVPEDWVRTLGKDSCWASVEQVLNQPKPEPSLLTKARLVVIGFFRAAARRAAIPVFAVNRAVDGISTRLVSWSSIVAFLCALIASAMFFLPERPLLVSIPWIIAGVAAGCASILRRKVVAGIIACLAAVALPFGTLRAISMVTEYLDPTRLVDSLPPIGEMYSTMPRRSEGAPRPVHPPRSGIPALGFPEPAAVEEQGKIHLSAGSGLQP